MVALKVGGSADQRGECLHVAESGDIPLPEYASISLLARTRFVDDTDLALPEATGKLPQRPIPPPGVAQRGHGPIEGDIEAVRPCLWLGQAPRLMLRGLGLCGLVEGLPDGQGDPLHRRGRDRQAGEFMEGGGRQLKGS
jgi:hypothetical protein